MADDQVTHTEAVCPDCGYSMYRARLLRGIAQCPECGTRSTIRALLEPLSVWGYIRFISVPWLLLTVLAGGFSWVFYIFVPSMPVYQFVQDPIHLVPLALGLTANALSWRRAVREAGGVRVGDQKRAGDELWGLLVLTTAFWWVVFVAVCLVPAVPHI